MQIVDSHCHFWRLDRGDYDWLAGEGGPLEPIRRDFLPADYPGEAELVVVQAAASLAETDYLLSLAPAEPRIRGVVGWVNLTDPKAADALKTRATNPLFKGIRPMLQDIEASDWILTAPRADALEAVEAAGLRFDALVTVRHLPFLARFAADHPSLPVVIDHAAKPQPGDLSEWEAGMRALARDPRIHCKLSGLMTELSAEELRNPEPRLRFFFRRIFDWFGPERLLWGTDWPVLTLAASHQQWLDWTESLLSDLTESERQAILGGNARRFYGLLPQGRTASTKTT